MVLGKRIALVYGTEVPHLRVSSLNSRHHNLAIEGYVSCGRKGEGKAIIQVPDMEKKPASCPSSPTHNSLTPRINPDPNSLAGIVWTVNCSPKIADSKTAAISPVI